MAPWRSLWSTSFRGSVKFPHRAQARSNPNVSSCISGYMYKAESLIGAIIYTRNQISRKRLSKFRGPEATTTTLDMCVQVQSYPFLAREEIPHSKLAKATSKFYLISCSFVLVLCMTFCASKSIPISSSCNCKVVNCSLFIPRLEHGRCVMQGWLWGQPSHGNDKRYLCGVTTLQHEHRPTINFN